MKQSLHILCLLAFVSCSSLNKEPDEVIVETTNGTVYHFHAAGWAEYRKPIRGEMFPATFSHPPYRIGVVWFFDHAGNQVAELPKTGIKRIYRR